MYIEKMRRLTSDFAVAADKFPGFRFRFQHSLPASECFRFTRPNKATNDYDPVKARRVLTSLATEALSFLPAKYLNKDISNPHDYPSEVLWCLGVIQTFWRLGTGMPGGPRVTMRVRQGKKASRTIGTLLENDIHSQIRIVDDLQKRVQSRINGGASKVDDLKIVNDIEVFQDSKAAMELVSKTFELPETLDNLVPTFLTTIRLAQDIEDLLSVATLCGTGSKVEVNQEGLLHLCGWSISSRLGFKSKMVALDEFKPQIHGNWSYGAKVAIGRVIPLLAEYEQHMGFSRENGIPYVDDYSSFPKVPDRIINEFNTITQDLKNEFELLKLDRDLVLLLREPSAAEWIDSLKRFETESRLGGNSNAKNPKRRGRKLDHNTPPRESQLAVEWEQARDAGTDKVDFAKDKGMTCKAFDQLLDRVYKRKIRSDN